MDTKELLTVIYNSIDTDKKREIVRSEFLNRSKNINSGDIKVISIEDLKLLFNLYDEIFLNFYFRDNFKGVLKFSLSQRMSRNAGKTVMSKSLKPSTLQQEIYEIVMAVKFFFNYSQIDRDKKVNGIYTSDALNAFQLVLEHEICHLIEFHIFKESSCKGQRFKNLAHNIFAHTDVYHQLPTEGEIAQNIYGFKLGDKVSFEHEGKKYKGIINRVNKRATVMVVSSKGEYVDKLGNRYVKWYVPLGNLKRDNK
jgi:hypothetical protein